MAPRAITKWRAVIAILSSLLTVFPACAFASWTETPIETFTGTNGANPYASLIADSSGNLYGTTFQGAITNSTYCTKGCGVVFEMTPISGGGWNESVLYQFCSLANCPDGYSPYGSLTLDSSGNLYGTTKVGGAKGEGTVFELTPGLGSWTDTVLYSFCTVGNCLDGAYPLAGVIFDSVGNLYGTTSYGGDQQFNYGTVFELSPGSGGWTETVLYNFCSSYQCADGEAPSASLVFDSTGNLYGTGNGGGVAGCVTQGCGVVFKLTPISGGKWQQTVLHTFTGTKDGGSPYYSGLVFDSHGNLYGTTAFDGTERGVVFELVASLGWKEREIHLFTGGNDGAYPYAGVVFDSKGNLYGTAVEGGTYGYGVVFELKRGSNGHWGENVLHAFAGGTDGEYPYSGLIFDASGNVYGTTWDGGDVSCPDLNGGCGTVFELTP